MTLTTKHTWETDELDALILLRVRGFAVAYVTPEELDGAPAEIVEQAMAETGRDTANLFESEVTEEQ